MGYGVDGEQVESFRLHVFVLFGTLKQCGAGFAGRPLVEFPNLIGPIRRFAEMLGHRAGLDHRTNETNCHFANLGPFPK